MSSENAQPLPPVSGPDNQADAGQDQAPSNIDKAVAGLAPLKLMEVLKALVNDSPTQITDINGNKYNLPMQLSTRAMLRVGATVQSLIGKFNGALGADANDLAGVMRGIMSVVLADEGCLRLVEEAFTNAHPKIAAEAIKNLDGGSNITVADCFAIDELVGVGLVPFLLKPGTRLWDAAVATRLME